MIATKVLRPHAHGAERRAACRARRSSREIDASLKRLGTDYVDLYQIHRWDYATPIEETLEALHDVVKAGKARYIGASSMYAWQFAKALHLAERHGWTRFVDDAEPRQPALPRGGARDAAAVPRRGHRRDPVEPARPRPADARLGRDAARATETDEFGTHALCRRPPTPTARSSRPSRAVAAQRGVPRAQVALAWVLQQAPGSRAPIVGATKLEHLDDAVAALRCSSSAEEIAALEAPYVPHAVAGI